MNSTCCCAGAPSAKTSNAERRRATLLPWTQERGRWREDLRGVVVVRAAGLTLATSASARRDWGVWIGVEGVLASMEDIAGGCAGLRWWKGGGGMVVVGDVEEVGGGGGGGGVVNKETKHQQRRDEDGMTREARQLFRRTADCSR